MRKISWRVHPASFKINVFAGLQPTNYRDTGGGNSPYFVSVTWPPQHLLYTKLLSRKLLESNFILLSLSISRILSLLLSYGPHNVTYNSFCRVYTPALGLRGEVDFLRFILLGLVRSQEGL